MAFNGCSPVAPQAVLIDSAKTLEVAFTTDHKVLLNNETDLTCRTSPDPISNPHPPVLYPGSCWTFAKRAHPVSHTGGQVLAGWALLEVNPPDAEEDFELHGEIDGAKLDDGSVGKIELQGSGGRTAPGRALVTFVSTRPLPKPVQEIGGDIRWKIVIPRRDALTLETGASWGHRIFVTLGFPESRKGNREANDRGITTKRMEESVKLVADTGTREPHAIARALHKKLAFKYALIRDKAISDPSVDHPRYFNVDRGGAWDLLNYIRSYGECQAEARAILAVMKQVGCPGRGRDVYVYADPSVDNGSTGLADYTGEGTRLVDTGVAGHFIALSDSPLSAGQRFSLRTYINAYEACLLFEFPEGSGELQAPATRNPSMVLYGGGTPDPWPTLQEMLVHAFPQLVEVKHLSPPGTPDEESLVEVVRIIAAYYH